MRVVVGDALRVLPMLRGPVDFMLIDAKKEDYLDYLRAVEPRLIQGRWWWPTIRACTAGT